jgi:hypothetical protein
MGRRRESAPAPDQINRPHPQPDYQPLNTNAALLEKERARALHDRNTRGNTISGYNADSRLSPIEKWELNNLARAPADGSQDLNIKLAREAGGRMDHSRRSIWTDELSIAAAEAELQRLQRGPENDYRRTRSRDRGMEMGH